MTPPSRLLLLLSLLQTQRRWPGRLLAERLEVHPRTLRRDIDRLREMGYRIQGGKGPDGGYRLSAGTELPPLLFDDDQVIALSIALQAATTAGAGVEEAALRALTSVRQVTPQRLRHRLDAVRFTALPGQRANASPVSTDELVALSGAIAAREGIRFDYANDSGDAMEPPPRRVEPHSLIISGGRWYLVAWDLERDDWRIFRADRITTRTPTGPRFEPRPIPGGDVRAFVSARFKGSERADEWPCVGTVLISLPARSVRPFAGDGTVDEVGPELCRYRSGSWSWVALAASLGRFDADLEVVEPPELQDAFRQLASRFSAAAAPSGEGASGSR